MFGKPRNRLCNYLSVHFTQNIQTMSLEKSFFGNMIASSIGIRYDFIDLLQFESSVQKTRLTELLFYDCCYSKIEVLEQHITLLRSKKKNHASHR